MICINKLQIFKYSDHSNPPVKYYPPHLVNRNYHYIHSPLTFLLERAIRWSRRFSASPGGRLPHTAIAIRVYVKMSTDNGITNCKAIKVME